MIKRKKKKAGKRGGVKRCPNCNTYFGGSTLWQTVLGRGILSTWYHIECNYCHYCGKTTHTRKGAIRAWNRERRK